jgi:hypothetical protein
LRKGRVVGERFQTVRGVLVLLKSLSDGPASTHQLGEALSEAGVQRDERTVRRWLEVMREEEFGVSRGSARHELTGSPVRIALGDYEALATLSVLDSLAQREPVYGEHLASAAKKLREAIPDEALRFADSGMIEFSLDSASDPPEDPNIIDTLRRATHRSQKARVLYFSLRSGSVRWRPSSPCASPKSSVPTACSPTNVRRAGSRSSGSTASTRPGCSR